MSTPRTALSCALPPGCCQLLGWTAARCR